MGSRPCSAEERVTRGTVRGSLGPSSSVKAANDAEEKRGMAANKTAWKLNDAIAATPYGLVTIPLIILKMFFAGDLGWGVGSEGLDMAH